MCLSIYLRHFLGLSVTETTLFATLPMVVNIVFQTFVWGAFSDKYQLRRTLIICGEVLAGFGTVLVWYAHTLTDTLILAGYVIIIGLSLIEIFWSMSNVVWSALISDIYRQEDRNAIQGRLASIGGIGRDDFNRTHCRLDRQKHRRWKFPDVRTS
ncbi:MAG: MFS transporter [Thermodesulfobacteriota bacterium]|nr:MFS transporter [Thermodesulfobacteriota bacterium]